MNFETLIQNIPDYLEFLTVEEMDASSKALAAQYPDICAIQEMGKSREGRPIYCLKIGNGSKNAFMFGCPHPNEPMGAMMLEYFSRALCEDDALRTEFDYTWYLIKSIDVDGTKRNEKWFKGPFNLYTYARNYFRPVGYEQAEWTFPIQYKNYTFDKPIPETKVLMDIIDTVKPDFMYSLHNAGFGGAYWYISRPAKELYQKFYDAASKHHVPLHLGEPEVSYIEEYSKAIYEMIGLEADYDHDEQYGSGKPWEHLMNGTSSDGYAKKYDTFCLVAELPYFYSSKIEDQTPLDITRLEAIEAGAKFNLEEGDRLATYYDQFKELCSKDNPYVKLVAAYDVDRRQERYESTMKWSSEQEEYKQPCTVAQYFDNYTVTKFYKMLSWGSLARGAEFERDKRKVGSEEYVKLDGIAKDLVEELQRLSEIVEQEIDYEFVPIKRLVGVQLESGMIVAEYIKNKKSR